ncbi:MAG: helical backbone metal receptor [Acidobacteriota bacterium]
MSDRSPQTLISLTCSNTEIVSALGCADRLVAVDDHSDFPPEVVERLPRVGPDLTIDVPRVAALEPDLVLASLTVPGHEKVVANLEAAGLPFIAPAPQSIEDVYSNIVDIASLLGVDERGLAVVEEMRRALEPAPPRGHRPSIAVQWWPKPVIVPGQKSWVHDLIERAGGRNVLDEPVESRPLTDEEFAAMAPDAVVLSWCGVEEAKYRPDVVYDKPLWRNMPAVRRRRVVPITEAWLGRPSPRLAEGYRALRRLIDVLEAEAEGPAPPPV